MFDGSLQADTKPELIHLEGQRPDDAVISKLTASKTLSWVLWIASDFLTNFTPVDEIYTFNIHISIFLSVFLLLLPNLTL